MECARIPSIYRVLLSSCQDNQIKVFTSEITHAFVYLSSVIVPRFGLCSRLLRRAPCAVKCPFSTGFPSATMEIVSVICPTTSSILWNAVQVRFSFQRKPAYPPTFDLADFTLTKPKYYVLELFLNSATQPQVRGCLWDHGASKNWANRCDMYGRRTANDDAQCFHSKKKKKYRLRSD